MKERALHTARRNESGNALWFILLAIVLLAGLTVLMSRSSSTTDEAGDFERGQIQASEVLRVAKDMELAVQRLKSQGCSENEMNFDYAPGITGYENAARADGSCDIFGGKGAGLVWREPPGEISGGTWLISGDNRVQEVGCDSAASRCVELLAILPDISLGGCLRINTLLGVDNPAGAPPADGDAELTTKFQGSFTDSEQIAAAELAGKVSGCFDAGGGNYVFYNTLIRR